MELVWWWLCGAGARRGGAAIGVAALVLLVGIWGCGGKRAPREVTPQELLARAEQKIADEDYLDAVEILTSLTVDYPGVAFIDRVVFQLGRAHLESGDHVQSEAQFRRLARDYPFSEYADDASFLIAEGYFRDRGATHGDPTQAEAADAAFRRFLREHPESELVPEAMAKRQVLREWFAKKAYDNGKQYQSLGRLPSAEIYYEKVAGEYVDTEVAPAALIGLAEVRHDMKQDARACEALDLLSELPASDQLDEAMGKARDLGSDCGCGTASGEMRGDE